MKWLHTERSRQDYQSAPPEIRKAFEKQVRLLAHNLRHPSLRAKKYHEAAGGTFVRCHAEQERGHYLGCGTMATMT